MHDKTHNLPDSSFPFVADKQCAHGRHHASRVNKCLSKVVLEEGKLQAQAGGGTQQSAMENRAVLYLAQIKSINHKPSYIKKNRYENVNKKKMKDKKEKRKTDRLP